MIMVVAAQATTMALGQQPFGLDETFGTQILTSGVVTQQGVGSLQTMPDGTIVISGQFRFPGDQSTFSGARLAPNGSRIEHIFQMGGRITPWNDEFYCGNGQGVKRFASNWTHDPTFDMNSSWPLVSIFQGGDYHVFPDGRLLVTGSHDMNDPMRGFMGPHQLVWFQNNGYLDTTRTHRQCNGILWTLKEQPDGKLLVGSWCTQFEGRPVGPVFRMHADGSLDTTFTAFMQHADYTYTYAFHTDQEGRCYAAGTYTSIPGVTDTVCVVRMQANGERDPVFHLAAFRNHINPNGVSRVTGMHLLENGQLVVTGDFDSVDGHPRKGIALLHADGNIV